MKAVTDEIPLDACRTKYESLGQLNLRKMMPQNVMESQLCAQKEGIDTCQGMIPWIIFFLKCCNFHNESCLFSQVIQVRQSKLFPTTLLRDTMQLGSSLLD